MLDSAMADLTQGSPRPWTIVCKLVDEWLLSDDSAVPVLLRGVFVEKPTVEQWLAIRTQIEVARHRVMADKQYQRRREYMRSYMRKRKQQSVEQH